MNLGFIPRKLFLARTISERSEFIGSALSLVSTSALSPIKMTY